jgi:hypothetical protein
MEMEEERYIRGKRGKVLIINVMLEEKGLRRIRG